MTLIETQHTLKKTMIPTIPMIPMIPNDHVSPGHISLNHVSPWHVSPGYVSPGLEAPASCVGVQKRPKLPNDHVSHGHVSSGHVSSGHVSSGHEAPASCVCAQICPKSPMMMSAPAMKPPALCVGAQKCLLETRKFPAWLLYNDFVYTTMLGRPLLSECPTTFSFFVLLVNQVGTHFIVPSAFWLLCTWALSAWK